MAFQRKTDENLFAETTMTFGEHLEDLRQCLFKAVIGLAIGFVLGLFVGGRVVEFIQRPLKLALTQYYEDQSLDRVESHLVELRAAGYTLPDDPDTLKKYMSENGLMFEEVFVNPHELLHQLQGSAPPALLPPTQQGSSATNGDTPSSANTTGAKPLDKSIAEKNATDSTTDGATDSGTSGEATDKFTGSNLVPIFFWRRIADDTRVQTKSLNAHEAFAIYIKAALLVGALLASPWIFYQIWSFVAAGLYKHERYYVHVFLPFSLGLFFAGAALAFFFVFEPVLTFLFSFNKSLGIDPDPRISEWLGFVLILPLGFGVSFQLPLVMLFLERIGIFDVHAYLSRWRIAILVIFVLSMFLTPADPTSMLLMAAPLTVLYFGGVLLCKYMPRRKSPYDELDEG